MFNMLTFEVDYLFKQSVNPPQIFRIRLVVFELHIKLDNPMELLCWTISIIFLHGISQTLLDLFFRKRYHFSGAS